MWLHALGARVYGYALAPPTHTALFDVARVGELLDEDVRADIADVQCLCAAVGRVRPEIVFHMAAQPLVRESYREPLYTFATNVMGTAHVLEAARECDAVQAVVVVTTDKVYENLESARPFRESDALGGYDPYSASKAAAEILTASYRRSFFGSAGMSGARVATARAGNVIGGGDWAADRLVPDCLRAFRAAEPVRLRFPAAVRPWQHVFEPLSGYLQLAQKMCAADGERFAHAWNFGPSAEGDATVGAVAETLARLWGPPARVERATARDDPHEAGLLHLDSAHAREHIGWRPRWSLEQALQRTVEWHRAWLSGSDMRAFSFGQIDAYEAVAHA